MGALLAGLLGGVSELSLYGIHLHHRRVYRWLLAGCAAGGVTSAVFGWLFPSVTAAGESVRGVTTNAFAFTSLLTIPVFSQMWVYAVSIAVSFIVSMVLIIMLLYRKHKKFDGGSLPDLSLGVWSWQTLDRGLRTDQLLLPKVGLPVSQLLAGTIVVISAILINCRKKKSSSFTKIVRLPQT